MLDHVIKVSVNCCIVQMVQEFNRPYDRYLKVGGGANQIGNCYNGMARPRQSRCGWGGGGHCKLLKGVRVQRWKMLWFLSFWTSKTHILHPDDVLRGQWRLIFIHIPCNLHFPSQSDHNSENIMRSQRRSVTRGKICHHFQIPPNLKAMKH